MNLNEVAIFVKIVETGSFVGAAGVLDMPKSTVSARLSSLEKRLGVTLIRRTTRKLHVTEAGERYFQECMQALSQITAAEEEVLQTQSEPHGPLKLTAPVDLGGTILPNIIQAFSKKYPQVNLEILLTDRTVDLIGEKIDIGIRTGTLKDSSLISKKLGTIYFAPFAGPKFLKNLGTLKSPKELENICTISFSPLGSHEWQLISNKEKLSVKMRKKTLVNDLGLIKSLAMTDLGIALIPTYLCTNEVKSGKLIRIFKNWRTEIRPVHFVYPSQKFVSPKIKAFIELAAPIIKESLESAEL